MFVRELGGREAGPVVWIHGLGESGLCFERIVQREEFAAWRHLAPDMPGYGRSAWPDEPAGMEALADLLARWLSERGEGPVSLIGHSMGGVVGLVLAERHPDQINAFVNVDGNVAKGDCTFSGLAAAQPMERFVAAGFDELRDQVFRTGANDESLRGYYASLRLADPRAYHLHSAQLVEASGREDMAARMSALDCPAWYVAGVPRGVCQRGLELLADAGVPVVGIEPSGHTPFIDQPETFACHVAAMLASLRVGRR
jgi:pimeloyl-ACP methyl ester carboxylesterase